MWRPAEARILIHNNIATFSPHFLSVLSPRTTNTMLSTLPILALLLLPYTICTLASPIPQSDLATTTPATQTTNAPGGQSPPDLSSTLGDLVIPQEERPENSTTATSSSRKIRSQPDLSTLLGDIGDFRLPSNITAGHVAKVAK